MAKRRNEEVEIKVAIGDRAAFTRLLKRAGLRMKTRRTFESNILYDFPDLRLRERGELVRVRQYGEVWTLTYKAKGKDSGRHKRREEIETRVENGHALELMLIRLGLSRSFAYDKYRAEWTDGHGDVVIDETPIGYFAELEGPPRWIDGIAKKLGLGIAEYITASYAELFFAWKQQTGSSAQEMTFADLKRAKPLTKRR